MAKTRVKKYTARQTYALVEKLREDNFQLENEVEELSTTNRLLVKLLSQTKPFKFLGGKADGA